MKYIDTFDSLLSKLSSLKSLMIIFVDPSILTPS